MFRAWLASQLREIADDVENRSVDPAVVCRWLFGLEDQDISTGTGEGKGKGKVIIEAPPDFRPELGSIGKNKGKGKGQNSELGGKGNRSTPY